jgi:hypothetical protein
MTVKPQFDHKSRRISEGPDAWRGQNAVIFGVKGWNDVFGFKLMARPDRDAAWFCRQSQTGYPR